MKMRVWTLAVLLGFAAKEAKAYELGAGVGRISGCYETGSSGHLDCGSGPTLNIRWGLNLWGKGYDIAEHEKGEAGAMPTGGATVSTQTGFYDSYLMGQSLGHADSWEEIAAVVVVSVFMVSLGYALVYPFSSRADIGFVGRLGYQSNPDFSLSREEAGIYLRGYLSQHFPLYIYGSGKFSHQTLSNMAGDGSYNAFVKSIGLGLMAPDTAGPYFQGTWERSSLLNPSAKDVIRDASTERLKGQSLRKILDASHFELGYTWYY